MNADREMTRAVTVTGLYLLLLGIGVASLAILAGVIVRDWWR